jgi:MFS family permease
MNYQHSPDAPALGNPLHNTVEYQTGRSTRRLTAADYKTLAIAALGGALEFYDFIIFVYLAQAIGQLFFPPEIPDWLRQLQTFGIFAAGYLVRPLGGIFIAHFGDLFGRKRMFTISIFLMAVATLGMGLLPVYAQIGIWAPAALLVLRLVQGAAVGGEVPGAWVFVAEHVPSHRIGLACGTLTGGLTLGILLGAIAATLVNSNFTPAEVSAFAWRLPFVLGGLFGLCSVYLRRLLRETPVFLDMQERKAIAAELPLRTVLRDHKGAVAVSMLLTWFLSSMIVVVILMTPSLLQKLAGVPIATALKANTAATLCLIVGCVGGGALIDRVGAGRFFAFGSILLGASVWLFYTQSAVDPSLLMPLYALTGLLVGVVGGVPFVMIGLFPPPVRFSGISFSYNIAYAVFGGLTPVFVSVLLPWAPSAHVYYLLGLCACVSVMGIWLWRREAATLQMSVQV